MEKKGIIAMFMVLLGGTAGAQEQEGVITFETRVNLHRNIPPEREEVKSMMPEFRTSSEQLFFNQEESLYRTVEDDGEEEEFGGGGIRIRMGGARMETYTHKTKAQRLTQQEFMGKNYLIEDTLKIAPWKFGSEIKTILDYECRQAYYTDESEGRKREITAWFTGRIRPFLGPEIFNSLPGTVLAVDINNGERVIVATGVEFRPLKKSELKVPGAGTRISRNEFRKLMDVQQQQMRERGGNVMMRR
ncbi:MAG: GLPGLI family protein [Prolixibacteraceae bacterium]